MAAKEERSEDLNPRSKELDEKIRQLLDPSVPDVPASKAAKKEPKKSETAPEIAKAEGKRSLTIIDSTDDAAGEPAATLPVKKDRKVIVPVSHEDDEAPALDAPDTPTIPVEAVTEKPVVKIDVDHEEESKEELAEKLEAAIADLSEEKIEEPSEETAETADDAVDSEEDDDTEDDLPTAPPIDGAPKVEEAVEPTKPAAKAATKPVKTATTVEPERPLPEPPILNDKETDAAVKDILTKEGDELLGIQDKKQTAAKKDDIDLKDVKLITPKLVIKLVFMLLFFGIVAAMVYPTTRYLAFNTAGLRSKSSLRVIDNSTQQPVKNAKVTFGSATGQTDADGVVAFEGLKLGETPVKIERMAFQTVEKTITVGWGSNPLGDFGLTATGVLYKIQVSDVLSAKAVEGVEAETEGAAARADANGLITLNVPQTEATELKIVIKAPGYRDETLQLSVSTKETAKVVLTPSQRHVFISKRSGKFDMYSVYVDGKDEKLLLAGSGSERDDLTLLPQANTNNLAYVSTRAGKKNTSGYLLSDLVLVDSTNGRTTPVATAERIQLIGWQENRLVYVTIAGEDAAADPKRNKLMSYSTEEGKATELASSNYFNDLLLARGLVYYAPSSAYEGGTPAQFFVNKTDGSDQKAVFGSEVWKVIRTAYEKLSLSVGQDWYEYDLGTPTARKVDAAPVSKTSRVYIDSPDGKNSAWVEQRDGKGTLLIYDVAGKKDTVLFAKSGVSLPVVWLNNDTLIFRVSTADETADYVVSLRGGEPKKLRDVTKTSGLDNWYYY